MGVPNGDAEIANAGLNLLVVITQWSLVATTAVVLFAISLFLSGYLRTFLVNRSRAVLAGRSLSADHAMAEAAQRNT